MKLKEINSRIIPDSELIVNQDKSIYHIHLREEHVADNVIVVGDQGRVERVSMHFDKIEAKIENREFVTHVGTYNGKKITVMSTGIGTDNIDIAINELDAAVNIDLETKKVKPNLRKLNIVRIGTSGALQGDIPVDSFVLSEYGLGFDGLLHYYDFDYSKKEKELNKAFKKYSDWAKKPARPYFVEGSQELISKLEKGTIKGITATASGFYGPQGRILRLPLKRNDLNEVLTNFYFDNHRITNFEMETSALYGLGKMLGHNCATVCAIIANRIAQKYSADYKKTVDKLIVNVLEKLTK